MTYAVDATKAVTRYLYDGDGNVTQTVRYTALFDTSYLSHMQDWDGAHISSSNLTTYSAYDNAGRLSYAIDATSAVTHYVYDAGGRPTQVVQYATAITSANIPTVDSWATNNASTSDRTTRSTYDNAGRLIYNIDAAGQVAGYTYDAAGRVTLTVQYKAQYTNPAISIQTWVGNNASATNDRVTRSYYDAVGRLAYSVDASGAVSGYVYDANGNVTQATQYSTLYTNPSVDISTWLNTAGHVTRSIYDAAGRVTYAIDAAGAVTAYAYSYGTFGSVTTALQYAKAWKSDWTTGDPLNMASWITGHTDATNDRTTTYTYDHDDHLIYVTGPGGTTSRYTYDAFGRKAYLYTANGSADQVKTRWVYNGNNQVTSKYTAYAVTGEQTLVKYSYDAFGNNKTVTDANNNVVNYTYDRDGRLLTTLTAGNGAVNSNAKTINAYNIFGDLTQVTDPLGNTGYFYYDAMGRQTWQVDAKGYATQTSYEFGQVKTVTRYANMATGYNVNTPPTVTTSGADNTTSFTHDAANRVLTSTDGNGYSTSYTYDAFGNRTTMTNALGATVSYTYDAHDQMLTQVTPAGTDGSTTVAPSSTTAYVYDMFGNRTQMIEAQGAAEQRTTTYVYDKDDQLVQQTGDAVTKTIIDRSTGAATTTSVTPTQSFTYDRRGNQISATDANNAVTYTYYDHNDRKIAQVDALGFLTTFVYDANGNVLSQTAYATALSLAGLGAGGTPPSPPASSSSDRTTTYTYDMDNQLVSTNILGVETGAWNGTTWTASSNTAITTQTVYDFDGNVVQQIDGNGNSTYTYYDALGRKAAQIDTGGYMTTYVLDAEGNVTSQTQYANALTGTFPVGGTQPSPPAINANDRTTDFTYDHDGQRLSETRRGVINSTVTANALSTTTSDVTLSYVYNGLGQVTRKIEATGDETDYTYDSLGHVASVVTAVNQANSLTTQTTYDRLGNVLTTTAAATVSPTTIEITNYKYGTGGRLTASMSGVGSAALAALGANPTQAQIDGVWAAYGTSYGYDANGEVTLQSYSRLMSNGTSVTEGTQTVYDALGHAISTAKATMTSGTWASADKTDSFYNAFGEVIARGTNTGGNLQKAQQYADYDNAGRVWHGNMDDGISRAYGYDANGNQTLQLQSLGTTDLSNVANLDAARAASGVVKTVNVYDSRDELTQVEKPSNANLDGTVTSVSNIAIAPTTVTAKLVNVSTSTSNVDTVKIRLSTSSITSSNSGTIHVTLTASGNAGNPPPQTYDFSPGTMICGDYTFSYPPLVEGDTPNDTIVISVVQGDGASAVRLLYAGFHAQGSDVANGTFVNSANVGSSVSFQEVNPAATTLKMYVRATGSSGGYVAVDALPSYDEDGHIIAGGFYYDTAQPPFNTTAGSSWDVKYLAKDVYGKVVDAKAGNVTFNTGSPPQPSAGNFSAIPVFTATASGGSWQLSTNALPSAYIQTSQHFNAFGDIDSQTDALGNVTTLTYDTLGDLTVRQNPLVSVVGTNGIATSVHTQDKYFYDKSGRLVAHIDPNGNRTTQDLLAGTGYDGTDALVTAQYNPLGGGTVKTTYDVFGKVLTVTDQTNRVTTNTYDKNNRLITVTHPDRFSGDIYNSGVTKLIDTYVYDSQDQVIKHSVNEFAGVFETTDYDVEGRAIKTVTLGGQTTTYAYAWTGSTVTTRATAGQNTNGQGTAGYWTKTTSAFGLTTSSSSDTFGKLLTSRDFGSHTTVYDYNLAGQVVGQRGTVNSYQSIDFTYTANGQIASIIDSGLGGKTSVFAYDANGNRTMESLFDTGASPSYYEDEVISYDAVNRITEIKDLKADINYAYDANGNRREIKSTYLPFGPGYGIQDYWYTYDSMNRFTLTRGVLSGGAIVAGSNSETITYTLRGDRATVQYGSDNHKETYTYSHDGYLETVSIAVADTNGVLGTSVLRATRTNDVFGQMTGYTEYKTDGTALSSRVISYDRDNRVTGETDLTYATDSNSNPITYKSVIANTYTAYDSATSTYIDKGVLISSVNTQTSIQNNNESTAVTTTSAYNYVWWNQAKQSIATVTGSDPANPNAYNWASGNSTYTYDVNGNLTQVVDAGGDRTVNYQVGTFGQTLLRQEYDYSKLGVQREFFYFNGLAIGDVGTDQLPSEVDYAQDLAKEAAAADDSGQAMYDNWAEATHQVNAHFDTYQPYNAASVDQSDSSYTVVDGDTLQSIASQVWGDPSLWYLLADANGLDASSTLTPGQILTVPGKVTISHNASGIYKPYDPYETLGDTNPTLPSEPQPPAPKQQGCGMVGAIIAIAVATVVAMIVAPYATAFVANLSVPSTSLAAAASAALASAGTAVSAGMITGASIAAGATASLGGIGLLEVGAIIGGASDIAYQGVQIAAHNQSKFSWKELGASILAGAIEARIGLNPAVGAKQSGGNIWQAMGNAAKSSIIQQGSNYAFGLQKKFDWTGLAVGMVEAGAGKLAGDWAGQHKWNSDGLVKVWGSQAPGAVLTGTAEILAGAATRTVISGQDIGKSVREEIPGVVGFTIGNAIGGDILKGISNAHATTSPDSDTGQNDWLDKAGGTTTPVLSRGEPQPMLYGDVVNDGRPKWHIDAGIEGGGSGQSVDEDAPLPPASDASSDDGTVVVIKAPRREHYFIPDLFTFHWGRLGADLGKGNILGPKSHSDYVTADGGVRFGAFTSAPASAETLARDQEQTTALWDAANPNADAISQFYAHGDWNTPGVKYKPGDRFTDYSGYTEKEPLNDFDAYNLDFSQDTLSAPPWWRVFDPIGAVGRCFSNMVTGGLADNLEAAMDSHSSGEYTYRIEQQHFLDGLAKANHPIMCGIGNVGGFVAQLAFPEGRTTGAAVKSTEVATDTTLDIYRVTTTTKTMAPPLDLSTLAGESSFTARPELSNIAQNDGLAGEQIAKQLMEDATGLEFRPIQNASGNGIDLIGVDKANKIIWAPEVKSSTIGRFGNPGNLLNKTQIWLRDAAGGRIAGQRIAPADQAYAIVLRNLMRQGFQLKPLVVNVSIPAKGATGLATAVVKPY